MPSFLGQFTVTAGQDTVIITGQGGLSGLLLGNESGLTLIVKMGGNYSRSLYPGTIDYFEMPSAQYTGVVIVSPKTPLSLGNTFSWPSSYVQADAVGLGEKLSGTYPMSLPRAAVSPTASGNPIFSATVGFGSTINAIQVLNVFNPQNSGVSYQFHSARFYWSGNMTAPTANLILVSGADLNLGTPITAVSHDAGANPPTTQAHCTAEDSNSGHGGTTIEVYDAQQNVTGDFLSFPDQVILRPGNNLRIAFTGNQAGSVCRLTMKWTEVPQVAGATTGGATTGNILTAANVVNNGNSAGTGVISASPSGDGQNTAFLDNAGNLTLGDTLHPALVTINGTIKFLLGSITRISSFSGTATTVVTAFNHGLGVLPDIILLSLTGTNTSLSMVKYDPATMTSLQVNVISDSSRTFVGLAIKF